MTTKTSWNMKRTVLTLAVALAVAVTLMSGIGLTTSNKAQAAGWCWCTNYVANYEGLPNTYPNAYQWPSWLPGQMWYETSSPSAGDIFVFQPNAGVPLQSGGTWTAGNLGHVAIVSHATYYGNYRWLVTMTGANQGWGSQYTDSGCTDVSSFNVWVTSSGSSYQFFYYNYYY